MRLVSVVLMSVMSGCNKAADPPTTTTAATEPTVKEQQADPPVATRQFTGTLRGGILAVGAETTGWQLETDDGKRLDVDVSKVADAAAELDGKRVTIESTSNTVNWPERGPRTLLRAHRIVPAAADDAK